MKVRQLQHKRGWAWNAAVPVVKPSLLATTTHTWIDGEKIPVSGGCLIALNHVSHIDPFTAAHLVYDHGRIPRYLAKSSLFENGLMRWFMLAAGQIPVERASANAISAYDAAVAAIHAGECVVVYPEGTITRDPAGWPMTGKSGVARIALATGCPVVPVGQWGAQALLGPYAKIPNVLPPRKHITMKVGDPVDLGDLMTCEPSVELTAKATSRIMSAITALVSDVRGEDAPVERFDIKKAGVRPTGDPNRARDRASSRSATRRERRG